MKLIIAIVRDTDNDNVSHALMASEFRVTGIASTGGFLRRGQTTLLIGLEDSQVPQALEIIRTHCTPATEPDQKSAVIFVLKVDQYIHY
jgi:uncharacterized protein YaaQ